MAMVANDSYSITAQEIHDTIQTNFRQMQETLDQNTAQLVKEIRQSRPTPMSTELKEEQSGASTFMSFQKQLRPD
jgi:hypothetical protein